jgi:cold shock CspA family protein
MSRGSVSKLVTSFGSRWGRIRPEGESREIFFNVTGLDTRTDFLSLNLGQAVEFEELIDHVNGSHAEHVTPVVGSGSAITDPSNEGAPLQMP